MPRVPGSASTVSRAGGLIALALATASCGMSSDVAEIEKAKTIISKGLIDPASAEFRHTRFKDGWVCGELNAKNRMNAFVGFKRFSVDLEAEDGLIDPEFDIAELSEAQQLCTSLGSQSACQRAAEQEVNQLTQVRFDSNWSQHCDPLRSRSVYQPPLTVPNTGEAPENFLQDEAIDDSDADEVEPEGSAIVDSPQALPSSATNAVGQPRPGDQQWIDDVIGRRKGGANETDPVEVETED